MTTEEKAKVARKRLLEDFEFWAKNSWFIRTKEAKIIPLVLNRAQRRLLACCIEQLQERGYIRLVILKGRQMGSSTFVEAFLYWHVSQREAQKALVVAHDKEGTKTIFTMTRRGHDKMPEALKPHTTASSTTELVFDKLDSAYRVATAGGDGIVRGDTITALHLSEVAWWPKGSALENYSGLMDSLPSGRAAVGTVAFEESTAQGFNMFYEHCQAARGLLSGPDGQLVSSDWRFVFLPWFWDTTCEATVPEGFERTPGELDLAEKVVAEFGDELTDAHLQFRRLKIAEKGPDLFMQEYPGTPDEAFLSSGAPVFDSAKVQAQLKKKIRPIALKSLTPAFKWEDSRLGELRCYLPHDENETYYIGGDVGFGVRKDASVLQVLDSKKRQAAVWSSNRISADWFGTVAACLARFYNDAELVIERNGPGILTNRVVHIDNDYQNVYREYQYDKITDTETEVVGFGTTVRSKPLVIEELRAAILGNEVELYDQTTLHELMRFIVSESGKYEAEQGHHDDHVLSLAFVNHIHAGDVTPIVNQDSWYLSLSD